MAFVLGNLTALQALQRFRDAEGNELNADDDFHAVLDMVTPIIDKHVTFDLSSQGLRDADMSVLVPFLSKWDTLEELNLSQNGIGDNGVLVLSQCLTSMPHLRILNLNGNSIGADGIRSLAAVLQQCHGLEELCLSDATSNATRKNRAILVSALENFNDWKALDQFRKTGGKTLKTDDDVTAVLDVITSIRETHSLDLSDMNLVQDAMISLVAALSKLDQLQTLNLSGNT